MEINFNNINDSTYKFLNDWFKIHKKAKKLRKIKWILDNYHQESPFVASGSICFNNNLLTDTAATYQVYINEWVELETKEEKAKKQREERLKKLDRIL